MGKDKKKIAFEIWNLYFLIKLEKIGTESGFFNSDNVYRTGLYCQFTIF